MSCRRFIIMIVLRHKMEKSVFVKIVHSWKVELISEGRYGLRGQRHRLSDHSTSRGHTKWQIYLEMDLYKTGPDSSKNLKEKNLKRILKRQLWVIIMTVQPS